jgi:dCMP deaminase
MVDGHCERTLHSEENAILNTAREDLIGATAYVTATPCYRCTRLLVNSGVKKIYFLNNYDNSRGKELIEELTKSSGVELIQKKYNPKSLINEAITRLEGPGGSLYKKED